jgi:hypothetical protein
LYKNKALNPYDFIFASSTDVTQVFGKSSGKKNPTLPLNKANKTKPPRKIKK